MEVVLNMLCKPVGGIVSYQAEIFTLMQFHSYAHQV